MLYTEKTPLTAESVIVGFTQTNELPEIKQSFTNIFLDWVASDTEMDQPYRSNAVCTYIAIIRLLDSIERFKLQGKEADHANS